MSPSEMSEAMDAVSNRDAIDAASSSGESDQYNEGSWFDPLAGLGLDTPVYGRSGMNARNAIDALIDMQAYPYVPGLATPNIDSLRNSVFKDSTYGLDRVPTRAYGMEDFPYAYGMEDFPTGQTPSFGMLEEAGLLGGARPSYAAPATQPTATQPTEPRLNAPVYGRSGMNEREAVRALVGMGYGGLEGLNPNNPDQTAQQLLNSFRANDFLTEYGPSLFTAGLPPGMGLAFNAIRSGANVLSGRTTPGQALMGVGLDALASKLGIPGGGRVVGDLLEGRVGPAAGGAVAGLATGALGRAGLGPLAGIAMKESGLGPAIQKSVSGAVQPQPGQGTRFVSSITDAINRGPQGIMGLFGGTPSAPIPATSGVTTPARAYVSPDSNLYESGGNEPPAVATAPTTPAATTPEAATRRLLYGTAQGPYGPLLAYDFGEA